MEACIVAAARSSLPTMQAVTWERVRDETSRNIYLLQLIDMAEQGFPDSPQSIPPQLMPYWRLRDDLYVVDGVLMCGLRAVIPPKLREEVIAHLHSAHQGVSQMNNRASECVFWPGITSDIQAARSRCTTCDINAPSHAKMPPADPFIPTAPFQAVASDYFNLEGKNYLLTVDRFSNWPDLRETPAHSPNAGVAGLTKACRELFATFGVPEQLSSDGGPEYTSKAFKDFLRTWGVQHRLSSAYHPQSNGRAEVTVKAMKRLLRNNVDHNGKLNTDEVTRAMLQLRNTPESDSGLSPAQILLGRTLRDSLPLKPPIPRGQTVFDHESAVSPVWKDVWLAKEHALKSRLAKQVEKLEAGTHALEPLCVGDTVRVQNQTGSHPNKWDKTGVIMQIGEHNQYIVRIDGSRRLTLRNRRFLRKMCAPSSAHPMQHVPLSLQPKQAPMPQSSKVEAQSPQDTSAQQPHVVQSQQTPATVQPYKRALLEAKTTPVPSASQAPHPPPFSENSQTLPAAGRSPLAVPPVEMPVTPITAPSNQQPTLQCPQMSQQLPDKRAPGRPCKKRIFNFTVPKVSVTQSPQTQHHQVNAQPGTPTGSAWSPLPRRSQRVSKKPDWFGER